MKSHVPHISAVFPAALLLAASFSSAAPAPEYTVKILNPVNNSPLEASASSINIRKDVAGNSCGSPEGCGGYRPALWPRGGAPVELKLFGIDHSIYKINDRGEMIGVADTPTGLNGVYWTRKTGELLQPVGRGFRNSPSGLNNLGVIIGSYSGPDGQQGPVVWFNRIPFYPTSAGPDASFTAINDRNQIVGTIFNEVHYAVRWDGFRLKYLPSGANAFPYDINDKGQIVGYSVNAGNTFPTLWSHGKVSYLSSLDGDTAATAALDINNDGMIVGSSGGKAVLWNKKLQVVNLNDHLSAAQKAAGIVLLSARAINEDGAIAGNARVPSSAVGTITRPFLMTPR